MNLADLTLGVILSPMHLTIRGFALGSIAVVSPGCSAPRDLSVQPQAVPQRVPVQQQTPSQHVDPARATLPPAAAPASSGAEPPADSNALCLQTCRKAECLGCAGAEDCKVGCQELLALPGCRTAMASFVCVSEQPLKHWECDGEVPVPAIRDGYCESQQSQVARCMGGAG